MIDKLQYISQELEPGNPDSHLDAIREFCDAGGKWVQLRVKGAGVGSILRLALEAKKICAFHGAKLIINDHVEIAKEVEADGIHLGKKDMPPLEARVILGPDVIIGGTANTWDDIEFLAESKVDYMGLGPFRFTTTKKELSPILGLEGYVEMRRRCERAGIDIPLIAIGGIRQEDVPALMKKGIHGIALSGFLTFHPEKKKAVDAFYKDLTGFIKTS